MTIFCVVVTVCRWTNGVCGVPPSINPINQSNQPPKKLPTSTTSCNTNRESTPHFPCHNPTSTKPLVNVLHRHHAQDIHHYPALCTACVELIRTSIDSCHKSLQMFINCSAAVYASHRRTARNHSGHCPCGC